MDHRPKQHRRARAALQRSVIPTKEESRLLRESSRNGFEITLNDTLGEHTESSPLYVRSPTRTMVEKVRKTFWVYIMTNRSGTLYTGVTGNLARRMYEHHHLLVPGFTSRYRIDTLIHAESFSDIREAIAREKQIKGWDRAKKLTLIATTNSTWRDLGNEWFGSTDQDHAVANETWNTDA